MPQEYIWCQHQSQPRYAVQHSSLGMDNGSWYLLRSRYPAVYDNCCPISRRLWQGYSYTPKASTCERKDFGNTQLVQRQSKNVLRLPHQGTLKKVVMVRKAGLTRCQVPWRRQAGSSLSSWACQQCQSMCKAWTEACFRHAFHSRAATQENLITQRLMLRHHTGRTSVFAEVKWSSFAFYRFAAEVWAALNKSRCSFTTSSKAAYSSYTIARYCRNHLRGSYSWTSVLLAEFS